MRRVPGQQQPGAGDSYKGTVTSNWNRKLHQELDGSRSMCDVISMKELEIQLEKLRSEAAECRILSDVATDPEKRELFAKVGQHVAALVAGVEGALAAEPANVAPAADDLEKTAGADRTFADEKQATKPRGMLSFYALLVVLVLTVAAGTLVWPHGEKNSSLSAQAKTEPPPALSAQVKAEPPPAPQEGTPAMARFSPAEEEKLKLLLDQLGALVARLDNLERARAEAVEPAAKGDPQTVSEPVAKRDVDTPRRQRHRRAVSSSRSGWQLFSGAPIR